MELVNIGTNYCERHKNIGYENIRRYRKDYDEKRKAEQYRKFYKSLQWKITREYILKRDNYLCQECLKENRMTPCNTVHHIIEIKEDYLKALDEDNLITICFDCHNKIYKRF